MTNVVFRRVRRLAVALLALACLSPVAMGVGNMPTLPEMLGYVPEPTPTAAALTEPFGAAPAVTDVGQVGSVAVAPQAPSRPSAPPARGRGAPSGTVARGAALPLLPPDQTPRGRYHRVEPGDTAASIASAYGLASKWRVYDANPIIVDPDQPPVGAWLYIPHPSMSPQARPRPGQPGYTGEPSATVVVDNIWLQLSACESSGNWGIDTGNGYYGGLQFTLSSWRAVGGAGYPHQAHPMEQIARADYLQRIQGWKAWPMCAGKLGLIPMKEAEAIVQRARAEQAGNEGDKRPAASERAGD